MDRSVWQPPQGYRQVDSTLPGITVYAPAPVGEKIPAQETFKCPRCGADTAYSPDAGSVTCSHCGYVEAIQAAVPGESAPVAEFTIEALRDPKEAGGRNAASSTANPAVQTYRLTRQT